MVPNQTTRRKYIRRTAASAGALALGGFASTPTAAQPTAVVGETGTITKSQTNPNGFARVSFEQSFPEPPVLIMSPASYNGKQPAHPRVRNVTADSFEFQIEEWDYLDGGHVKEEFHYLALLEGTYTVGNDSTQIEAGKLSANDDYVRSNYQREFDTTPAVLTQSQTFRGPDPIVSRGDVTNVGFDTRVQEEEAKPMNGRHVTEAVGYVAFEPAVDTLTTPEGVTNRFEAQRTPSEVTDEFYRINFEQLYDANPLFMAATQTVHGPDTTELRYARLGGKKADVFCEEERSADDETNHAPEVVGYLVFDNEGLIYA